LTAYVWPSIQCAW